MDVYRFVLMNMVKSMENIGFVIKMAFRYLDSMETIRNRVLLKLKKMINCCKQPII